MDNLHALVEAALYTVKQRPRQCSDAAFFVSYVKGTSRLDKSEVVSTLFDTGALCANYISRDKFEELREYIHERDIHKRLSRVGMADDVTTQISDTVVTLTLEIEGEENQLVQYTGDFVVLDMKRNEIIVGLPAIVSSLWKFFVDVVGARALLVKDEEYKKAQQESIECVNATRAITGAIGELRRPWSIENPGEEPEEVDSPLPVQFEYAHSFLGKPRDEAIQEYKDMWESHVSKEFAEATDIFKLLGDKGVKIFVPDSWEGVQGVGPIHLEFKDTLPERLKPATRYVNPRLWEVAEKEFHRLRGYFYEPSRSPWASPLVLAPKATKPFIRFCGDYVTINKYLASPNYYIPNVRHELDKIIGYELYLDIDLTNAFHQIRLDQESSEKLSVQTPWGQYRPKFVPEGISPGVSLLQETIKTVYEGFEDWAILLFDNALVLATDYEDAYRKFDMFLDRSLKHNVKLKFAKTWLGFKEVAFLVISVNIDHTSLLMIVRKLSWIFHSLIRVTSTRRFVLYWVWVCSSLRL